MCSSHVLKIQGQRTGNSCVVVGGSFGALGCFSIDRRRLLRFFALKNDSFWRRAGLGGTRRAFRDARVVDDDHVGRGTDSGTREAPNNRATPPKRGHFPLLQGDSQAL